MFVCSSGEKLIRYWGRGDGVLSALVWHSVRMGWAPLLQDEAFTALALCVWRGDADVYNALLRRLPPRRLASVT